MSFHLPRREDRLSRRSSVVGGLFFGVGKATSFVLNLLTLLVEGVKYKGPSGL